MSIDQYLYADQKAMYIFAAVAGGVLMTGGLFSACCSRDAGFLLGAFTVSVLGISLIVVAVLGQQSHGLARATSVIEANTDETWSIPALLHGVMAIGGLIAIVAWAGMLGATRGLKNCVAAYLLTTLLSGAALLGTGFGLLGFIETATPQILRQVGSFCQKDTYPQLYRELQCTDELDGNSVGLQQGLDKDAAEEGCNGTCQNKVSVLKKMGGCDMLTYLCTRNTYGLVGEGGVIWKRTAPEVLSGVCLLPRNTRPPMVWLSFGPRPSMTAAESTLEYCRDACNKDLDCTGFSYLKARRECALLSPNNPDWIINLHLAKGEKKVEHWKQIKHVATDTTEKDLSMYDLDTPADFGISDKYGPIVTVHPDEDVECYVKTTTRLVSRLLGFISALALLLLGLGVLLCCSTLHGLFLFMSRRRRAKTDPALSGLLYAMFCPCLPGGNAVLDMGEPLNDVEDDTDEPME
ncbi:unnamed protein product [Amoebophrya sp. A120]|nr:unnamed protein product [Amoebophrya sp. A120]|eukprot:GSA120T00005093001.1